MNEQPLVTVAIPTFNRASMVKRAIQSVLTQTYPQLQVIVSDNASTDQTSATIAQFSDPRLAAVRQPTNLGMVGNWNACLEQARGDYFILLSDDDILLPEAVDRLLRPFLSVDSDRIGLSYCRTQTVTEDATVDYGSSAPALEEACCLIRAFFSCKRTLYPCGIMMRTADVRSIGGYPETGFEIVTDAYVWIRIVGARGAAAFTDRILAHYMMHSANLTKLQSPDLWINNVRHLLSVAEQECSQEGHAVSLGRIKDYYLARLVAALILQSRRAGGSWVDSIRAFSKRRRYFLNAAGFGVGLLAIIKIFVRPEWVYSFRRLRSKTA